jgi:hypothetical protein
MPNERSDFDLLVITINDSAIKDLEEIYENVYEETHIEIDPKTIIDIKSAEAGEHAVNRIFSDNIRVAPDKGNIIGKNPLDVLRPANLSQFEEDEQYLIKKRGTFVGGRFGRTQEKKNQDLQRALEAPINMGRKMLQMFPYLGYPDVLRDISKKAVAAKFTEIFGQTCLMKEFKLLQTHDQNYTDLLKDTIKGFVQQNEYDECVEYLSRICIPLARNWTESMRLMHRKLIEGNFVLPEGNATLHGSKESLG